MQAANLIRKITLLYPVTAKFDGADGTVIMKAVISKEGNIVSIEQVNKISDARLAEAAIEAVKRGGTSRHCSTASPSKSSPRSK